jgi:hypothetical protein
VKPIPAPTGIQQDSPMSDRETNVSPLTSVGTLLILLLTRTVEWASSPNVARVSYEYNYRSTH